MEKSMHQEKQNLSKFERMLLSNQFIIMKKLEAIKEHLGVVDNGSVYYDSEEVLGHIESLREGYHSDINYLLNGLGEGISVETSKWIYDILQMYSIIIFSAKKLPAKAQEEIKKNYNYVFPGFDGNNEGELMAYTQYILNEKRQFIEITEQGDGYFNSHMQKADKYTRMLSIYNSFGDKKHDATFTKEEILKILEA